jgi:hypothetical protein
VRGLNEQLRVSCAGQFTSMLHEKKGLDDICAELISIDSLMPKVGRVNTSQGRRNGETKKKETRRCNYCGKVGHLKANCWKKQKDILLFLTYHHFHR